MIRNFFRKKGDDLNDNNEQNETNEAEIVDLAEEQQQQEHAQSEGQAGDEQASIEADLKNKLIRLQADFDNYRKRTATGRQEAREETRRELLRDMLPIYDNFVRAMGHAQEQEDYGSLRVGLQGIMQQMHDYFQRNSLIEIPATPGTDFDPTRHDAVGTVAGAEELHDKVAQEVLKGFELNGYVVRASQVLVYA